MRIINAILILSLTLFGCLVQAEGLTGTNYEIIESHESDESNSYENACMGKSSNMVRYRYETRKYTEYKDGVAVRTWMKEYKKFIKCLGYSSW